MEFCTKVQVSSDHRVNKMIAVSALEIAGKAQSK